MKKPIFFCLLFIIISNFANAQDFKKTANQAFVITRMIEKFHVQPKKIDEEFSKAVYDATIKNIDVDRILFTNEDLVQLEKWKLNIHNDVTSQKTNFVALLTSILTKRLQETDSFLQKISATKINFYLPETYTVKEDTSYPLNTKLAQQKLSKIVKQEAAEIIVAFGFDETQKIISKKLVDSLESYARSEVLDQFNRNIQKQLQFPGGVAAFVSNEYCSAIANYFDPHTEFFTNTQKQNFESGLGKKNLIFGFTLEEGDNGGLVVDKLLPGSPAFKSGLINKGDRLVAVQWEGSKSIDVSRASDAEISQFLSTSNDAKTTLTFIKIDGTKKEVTLIKEIVKDDQEDDRVTSFILKGEKPVGYILLPAFYEDWDNDNGIKGCANDIAKEIIKLKKENIAGLILDLRYNGGGSVQEAIDLAGIFIDAGPVGQVKSRDAKVVTLKDVNRGTIYDGPLTVLVNGFSASASELVAGVLQDYNRAIIIGSATYGKATGQTILPLDTNINLQQRKEEDIVGDALKITLSQLFQVSGKTAQFYGVTPDIILPDATDAFDKKERNEPFAIPSKNIEPNKYYTPLPTLPKYMLKEKATEYEKADKYFLNIKKYLAQKKIEGIKKDISLKIDDMFLATKNKALFEDSDDEDEIKEPQDLTKSAFTVSNNSYLMERLKSNESLKAINERISRKISRDSYINMAYKILLLMK